MIVLDISHHQHLPGHPDKSSVDMQAVKAAGVEAIIIRQAYGSRPDRLCEAHNRAADDAALPRLAYWYNLTRRDPQAMVEMAWELDGRRSVRAAMDIEESQENDGAPPQYPPGSAAYFNHVDRGLKQMDDRTGQLTMIYSRATYLDIWFTAQQQARWSERMLWVAHYNPHVAQPDLPLGWDTYALWQQKVAPFPGVMGNVDQNVSHPGLTVDQLLGQPPSVDQDLVDIALHLDAVNRLIS